MRPKKGTFSDKRPPSSKNTEKTTLPNDQPQSKEKEIHLPKHQRLKWALNVQLLLPNLPLKALNDPKKNSTSPPPPPSPPLERHHVSGHHLHGAHPAGRHGDVADPPTSFGRVPLVVGGREAVFLSVQNDVFGGGRRKRRGKKQGFFNLF